MVRKNTKIDKLGRSKKFSKRDTSYSSFWLYNREHDINSEHFRDSFVNFYDKKELLSEFNPTVAKNIISFWSDPGDIIFDPFSGRTRALVSYSMNRPYVGCEVSKDVVKHMDHKFSEIGLKNKSNFFVDIINDDCLNIEKYYNDIKFDLVFSCPPYWNLEKYESVEGQLSDIKEYSKFIIELKKRLDVSVKVLKSGGYICMVVGDFRKNKNYIKFHSDLLSAMEKNNSIKLHDIVAMQNIPFSTAAFYFGAREKYKCTAKSHEYLLVWRKK